MVSPELPDPISEDSLQTVRNAIRDLQAERQQFQQFIDEMLDGLEDMRVSLTHRDAEIRTARANMEAKQVDMDLALEKIQGAAEINATRRRELEERSRELAECRSQMAVLERERDVARKQMNEAVEELASVADILELVESTQEELDHTREELLRAREQLEKQQANTETEQEVEDLRRENQQLEQELRDSKKEASRLATLVEEQNRQLASQRERLSKDLRGLRDAVKQRTSSLRSPLALLEAESEGSQFDELVEDLVEVDESVELYADNSPDQYQENDPAEIAWLEFEHDHLQAENEDAYDHAYDHADESGKAAAAAAASSDPIIGSVLAKFAEIEKANSKNKSRPSREH